MTEKALLIPEMMEPLSEAALKGALERFYQSDRIIDIWPNAITSGVSDRLPLSAVEIVVLSLDRIGAPAGASGSSVYVAYYAHRAEDETRRAPSQPLVVKIGAAQKLREEKEGAEKWPLLNAQQRGKFAFPIDFCGSDTDRAVLIAPFQSLSEVGPNGSRNHVEVRDLWRLLENKEEISPGHPSDWGEIASLVAQALDAMEPSHRAGRGLPAAANSHYADQYKRYLRRTTETAKHVPVLLFGEERRTTAFGRDWPNPIWVVRRIVDARMPFSGILGAVHGDLHPKNIVLDKYNNVQIIDFGWAETDRHVIIDYVLLDLNLRGTTLPSQISESNILDLAGFLDLENDPDLLPESVRERARIICNVVWAKAQQRAVATNWTTEYLIPLFLVGYGLLVHLDRARNQPALVATVLHLAHRLDSIVPAGPSA